MAAIKYRDPSTGKWIQINKSKEVHIGNAAPASQSAVIWVDTSDKSVKYRDPDTGVFVTVASGEAVDIDDTLTVPGAAADAAAVGAELKNKYSAENEPPYPVKSVCGKTGAVSLTAGDVGADPSGRATGLVEAHNISGAAHNDIRLLISGLTTRLNALADSDDTTLDQLSEIVEYIKANKTLIDSITTSKVSVADIIDNLTTSVSNKPLSAKMGVELKKLIDAIEIPTSLPASDVYDWAKQPTKPAYTKNEVGLGNVDNVRQYSASNPPPYPVTSVNGQTGAVSVTADGIGAASNERVDQLSETIADLESDVKKSVKTVNGTAPDDNGNVDVIANIEPPKIVSTVDEMTDTEKHYVLNGKIWAHRTIITEGETVLVPNFTNLIKFDDNGNPTNVALNQRYSGSAGADAGYLSAQNGSFAITDAYDKGGTTAKFYISQKPVGQSKVAQFASVGAVVNGVGTINATDWANGENGEYTYSMTFDPNYVKFSAQISTSAITADSLKGLIVTLNEPIAYTEQKTEGETVSEWYDTGISYAPIIKADIIGVLGDNSAIYISDNALPSGTYTLKADNENYDTIGTYVVD